ncbi:unnamed protein product [Enterobius vermicularis]|uniref:DIX domain-containing protein n=1 Tax=Enterobius vermicularis TaxID=51028 RepID=A0A0N4VND8_ENTVE|nr:unnamed protein product [Enterobius vermicularis]
MTHQDSYHLVQQTFNVSMNHIVQQFSKKPECFRYQVVNAPTDTMISALCRKGRVPVVAHVPGSSITFREFRKSLGISSRSNMQFFFKCACEDGSAPYQLLLVNDDSAVLPIYDGKVTAECKTLSDSD